MQLFLVQHADAKEESEDPARGLSDTGVSDIERVTSYISSLEIENGKIYHSKKLRAKQTAERLSRGLKAGAGLEETDGLSPMDDPHIWFERLKVIHDSVALVGHMPHLGRLASLLICNDMNKTPVIFQRGGVLCLERLESGNFALRWMITPEIVL